MDIHKETFKNTDMTGEEIVVSGMSGIFPNSDSVQEFMENLYNKVDMVSSDPSFRNNTEMPIYGGKVKGVEKFDAQFFKVGFQQAAVLEPMARKLLEHTYGAIFDSGNTQVTLKDKKIGVFIGSSYADFSSKCMLDVKKYSELVVSGLSKSMFANRISYWLNGRGPSFEVDYSCASSTTALEQACLSIQSGNCEAAVVGGCNLCSNPTLTLNFKNAGLLCMDGKTKCFDKNGDGYVRAEAISLIFLQKAKDAKRVYAEVYHAQGSYQLKQKDVFLPLYKSQALQNFFNDVYSKIDLDPKKIEYLEANGSGLAEADANEIDAIANVFVHNEPVKLGCVKSNMGHGEAVSGLCAVTKLCLVYYKGEIPANLHYNQPVHPEVQDKKVKVLTENTKFDRNYTALNSFSLTGANYHVVMKGHYKEKNLEKYRSSIPRLLLASGRQESNVEHILESLKKNPVDAEEIALLHNIFQSDIVGHTGRGYVILDEGKDNTQAQPSMDYYRGVKPPLWFVYSGMGSQWAGMGSDLMRIPIFAAAIERCQRALTPIGIDLVKIITELDNKIFDNVINSFVGIAAVQIGLTDILKAMGVTPDYIVGHSLGEMACAYHDDTFTTEELILASYNRGRAIQKAKLIKGAMSAVGVGYKTLVKQCPPEIDIACHNSPESCTISGPADVVNEFVADLTKRGIFAKNVPSANVAYHSRYVAASGPLLLEELKKLLKNPKLRSKKWISTSVPIDKWDTPQAKYSSAEYHTNNVMNAVLFEEMTASIPANAVVVEIAPHGLLQAILKRAHKNCIHVPLTKRGSTDGVTFLLNAIGQLYQAGFNPKVDVLYPKVQFPVSTETPLLSHLIQWEHSETWPILSIKEEEKITSSTRNMIVSIYDNDYEYLKNHYRNGVNVLPESALLSFVWETFAMCQGVDYRDLSVVFSDVQFNSEIIITEAPIRLTIMITKGNNTFEVSQEGRLVVSGGVCEENVSKSEITNGNHHNGADEFEPEINLNSEDVYKLLERRGLTYKGKFQSIESINLDRTIANIKWIGDWISFLDSLIQINILTNDFDGVYKPKFIRRLKICILEAQSVTNNGLKFYEAQIDKLRGLSRCGGVEMDDITFTTVPLKENIAEVLEVRTFSSHCSTEEFDMETLLKINLQVIKENTEWKDIVITKVVTDIIPNEFDYIDSIARESMINTNIRTVRDNGNKLILEITENHSTNNTNVIIVTNLLQSEMLQNLKNVTNNETFILTLENTVPTLQSSQDFFNILTCMSDGNKIWILLKIKNHNEIQDIDYIRIPFHDSFSWVPEVYSKLVTTKRIVLVSERQPHCGLLGFVRKLRAQGHNNVSVFIIEDFNAPKFDPDNNLYKKQLQKNMTINIMKKGQWGGFYYTSSKTNLRLKSFSLRNLVPGNLDQLSWVEAPKLSGDRILVQVCYSGLSLRDCESIVDNNYNSEFTGFGMSFSGIDRNCERVMGLIAGGSMSSTIEGDLDLLWPVPEHWNIEDAATVPLPYIQAYYCLMLKGHLDKSKRVFIGDGAGSVGLALITLCISLNYKIFVGVDSIKKKKFVMNLFPELNEEDIFCSPEDYSLLMIKTNGLGCDIVFNFGTDIVRTAAASCVGFFGYFFDFSKQDMYENKVIGMSFLGKARSYIAVDINNIFRSEFSKDRKFLHKCITQGIKSGVVKPLTRVVFSAVDVTRAFRLMSLNKHVGEVLIRLREPSIMNNGLETVPRLTYTPQDVLIIVCDEKGIGTELADCLVERGARKIILHMKTNTVSGYMQTKFLKWRKQEVSIKLSSDNIQTEKGSLDLMKNAMKFGKVKGIFIMFDSKEADNGTKEDFISAYKKSIVAVNLELASRNCIDISHFIILSRNTQSASEEYAFSLIERVCDARNEMGLLTLVVRYESLAGDNTSKIDKIKTQPLTALFNAIEMSLKLKHRNVLTYDLKNEIKTDFNGIVAKLFGVKDLSSVYDKTFIDAFRPHEIIQKELRNIIKMNYRIDITNEQIRRMSIKSIKRFIESKKDLRPDFESGFFTFYKIVPNEVSYITSEMIVQLPTLLYNGISAYWEPSKAHIIMIPGFDGQPNIFRTAAERFKIRAAGVQLGPEMEEKSVRDIAVNIRKSLKFEIDTKFYIMGYSFGVNVALELAAILEKEGNTGTVYCVDSSPDSVRVQLDAYLGKNTNAHLQNNVLISICHLITGNKDDKLKETLEQLDEANNGMKEINIYEKKITACLKKMKGAKYSEQYKRHTLESAYKRIVMAQDYEPHVTLKSDLVLMKGIPHPNQDTLSDDYGLSKYSTNVKVFQIPSDHANIPLNCRISNIVNMFLDVKVLEDFEKKNLCDIYFADIKKGLDI